ncbi:MAG: hypothetical protein A4E64_01503 [Syntrophorhabdus sp. PtaU1.Bin058]|nr:MAG: hypothetical protein A4E64_01503 [Syntrophorhabdus sp. PtaU1.Bin058]
MTFLRLKRFPFSWISVAEASDMNGSLMDSISSYSILMSRDAFLAASSVSPRTISIGSPMYRTLSRARYAWSFLMIPKIFSPGISLQESIFTIPGNAAAALVSIPLISAWGLALLKTQPKSAPGILISSA